MRKLFNLSLGGNETTSNIKEENATLSIFVCVCVKQCVCVCVCVFNLKLRVKKNQPKNLCIKQ